MKASNKISRKFTLRNYETDFDQKLKPSALLGYFQETAGDHSEEMGLGFAKLAGEGRFWVLSKIYVEVDKRPSFRDEITVETWPHVPNKAIYERSFSVRGSAGESLLRAFSRWCILDAKNGRIVPCAKIDQPEIDFIGEHAADCADWRVVTVCEKTIPAFSLKIANSEYDLNNHVNNIKYADYIFNCFSVEELRARRLKAFQIHYSRQSHENDVLEFYREETGDGEFIIEGIKNGSEQVIAAKVWFE